jgi:hypothetical protein
MALRGLTTNNGLLSGPRPNSSVELTNCGKPQSAAHLER